jgi:phosphomannomutase
VFGSELSGHIYFRDNYYTDSGAISFATLLTILSAADAPLSRRLKSYQKYSQSGEMNFRVEDKEDVLRRVRSLRDDGPPDELDGVTIDRFVSEGWWVNVRASNTEPLLRLNLEGRDREIMERRLNEIVPLLGEPLKGHG